MTPGVDADIGAPGTRAETLTAVRRAVRNVLQTSDLYARADPADQRRLARGMVAVSMMAADLLAEDHRLSDAVRRRTATRPPQALATAQAAGDQLGMQAVRGAADVLARARDSIDFPTYVTSLISGVFQAILTSSTQQVGAIGDLLDNVSATAEEFQSSIEDDEVKGWIAGRFGRLFTAGGDGQLVPRPGVDLADHEGPLSTGLGATGGEVAAIDPEDLDSTLLPLARRKMGRDRQSVLASMMQMGLQRIVVDEGRIHASMDLRVDAQSLSRQDVAERSDWRVNAGAGASFSVGAWGANVQASTTVGRVKSDHQYTAEDVALRAGLRSSVDLAFRTEQVPLDRMADKTARVKIDNNARVPTDVSQGSALLPEAKPDAPSFDKVPTPPDVTPTQPLDLARLQPREQRQPAGTPPAPTTPPPTTPPGGTPPTVAPPPATTTPPPGGARAPAVTPPAGTTPPASTPPATTTPPPTTPPARTTPPASTPPPAATPPAGTATTPPPAANSPPPPPSGQPQAPSQTETRVPQLTGDSVAAVPARTQAA